MVNIITVMVTLLLPVVVDSESHFYFLIIPLAFLIVRQCEKQCINDIHLGLSHLGLSFIFNFLGAGGGLFL